MTLFFDLAYFLGLLIALPFLLLKSWRTGKYRRDLGSRFGFLKKEAKPLFEFQNTQNYKTVMLHCVSVGELLSVRLLVDRLMLADSNLRIAITTTTDTGTQRAKEIFGVDPYKARVETYRYPLDFSGAVKRVLNRIKPDLIVLVELEIWPNFIRIATKRKIPVVIINGRVTEKALKRYRRFGFIFKPLMRKLAWVAAQTRFYAERFILMGTPPSKVVAIPTLKYDSAEVNSEVPAGTIALARACGVELHTHHEAGEQEYFLAGSTGDKEEIPILQAFLNLKDKYPKLRLAIAPRHPENVPNVIASIREARLNAVLRSQRSDSTPTRKMLSQDEVLVLDTLGELRKLYYLASYVFVGRSLVPMGGSDMIEVAGLAKPMCFGPHTTNFSEPVELLLSKGGAVLVSDAKSLTETLQRWMNHPTEALAMGNKARQIIVSQQGSTTRYVAALLATMRGDATPLGSDWKF